MKRLRLRRGDVQRIAARLALAMLVADLAGRLRVQAEVAESAGRDVPVVTGLSFAEPTLLIPARIEPRTALEYFRRKTTITPDAYEQLAGRYRAVAFTVAELDEIRLIEVVQQTLDRGIAEGWARERFVREANERLAALGVTPLKAHHLRTVYTNNVHAAYNAGRIVELRSEAVRRVFPWWEYRTVGDDRVRDAHVLLDKFVARWDDPVWKIIFPPNGHNCRCGVFAVGEDRAQAAATAGGYKLDEPGLERIPAQPDPGFDHAPIDALAGRLPDDVRPAAGARRAKFEAPQARPLKEVADQVERMAEPVVAKLRKVEGRTDELITAIERSPTSNRVLLDELAELRGEWRRIDSNERARFLNVIRTPGLAPTTVEVLSRVDKTRRAKWMAGVNELARLATDLPDKPIRFRASRRRRSLYSIGDNVIEMSPNAGPNMALHELGHWLEEGSPGARRAARRFLVARTTGEKAQALRDLKPGRRYGIDEVARPDEFLDPYMGKIYLHGQTEILSTGLEWLYLRPWDLAQDREYFELILSVLRGES